MLSIQESTLKCFKSYLSNRRQRTKLSINRDQIYYSVRKDEILLYKGCDVYFN